jgi:hypothetical protein
MRVARSVLRLFVLSMLATAGVAGPAAAFAAEPYPVVAPTLTVSAGTTAVGDSITLNGTGFGPTETVDIGVTTQPTAIGQLGRSARGAYSRVAQTATTNSEGAFSTTITFTQAGTAIITATGLTSGLSASTSVLVLPAGSALPVTGSDGSYLWLLLIGSGLAAAGVVVTVLARSRRRPVKIEP